MHCTPVKTATPFLILAIFVAFYQLKGLFTLQLETATTADDIINHNNALPLLQHPQDSQQRNNTYHNFAFNAVSNRNISLSNTNSVTTKTVFEEQQSLRDNDHNNHHPLLTIQNISHHLTRRQYHHIYSDDGGNDASFVNDLYLFQQQMQDNYHLKTTGCQKASLKKLNEWNNCHGLGTTMNRLNSKILKKTLYGKVFVDVDRFSCGWFQRDQTKACETLFGNCYLPALTNHPKPKRNGTTATKRDCHSVKWLEYKHGKHALFIAHFGWLMGEINRSQEAAVDVAESSPSSSTATTNSDNCLALHIRRGDACINEHRKCFQYHDYYDATKRLMSLGVFQDIVVLTDADDFPLSQFQSLVPPQGRIVIDLNVNRSVYNVSSLQNESSQQWMPEHRDLANATSELFHEVARASQCRGLVGTLTSGISKWILMNIIIRSGGRIPPFESLQGCLRNVFTYGDFIEEGCD